MLITRDQFQLMRRNVTIAANTPTGPYTVTYTICESVDTANGANVSPSNCTSATVTVNVVGQIIATDDTLGTVSAPLFRYHTSIGRKCERKRHLKRTCRNDKQYECYPNHDGTNFSWCRRKRNHCSEHPNGSYTVPIRSVSQIQPMAP
jgi:hypothetical protein